ncbi:MAG: GreA/GreB family elongation factor, partial [Clostridia bacterium]
TMKVDQTLTIVGANETDAKNMKISSESPIGAALLGKRTGETVEVSVPAGVMKLKVLEITR